MSGYELRATDKPCPSCGCVLSLNAILCTRCGMDLRSGKRLQQAQRDTQADARRAPVKPVLECPRCKYDLGGLRAGTSCPECGLTALARAKGVGKQNQWAATREDRREAQVANYWRTTLLVAGIGAAVGVGLTLGVGPMLGWSPVAGAVHISISVVGLMVGYIVMGLLFLGFEEDIRGLLLRLLGVGTLWAGLWCCARLLPFPTIYGVLLTAMVSALALVIPLMWLTGRDWDDCCWIAFSAWVIRFVCGVMIFVGLGL